METQSMVTAQTRRSDRVPVCLPVEIFGIDPAGKAFSKRAITTNVNRFGCGILLKDELGTKELILQRDGIETKALGRVVCQVDSPADGNLYGIEFPGPCDNLWGIQFSTSLHERLLDALQEGVYFVDSQRRITYWNRGAERLSGYSASEAVGKCCFEDLLGHVDSTGKSLCRTACPLSKTMTDGQPRESEIYLRHKLGHRVPVSVKAIPMRDYAGRIVGAVEVFSDATARRKVETRVSELEHLAFRDALTGLPNRRYIEFKLAQALQEKEQFGREYGLLMIDVDLFKRVNDTYGHTVGDTALKTVAETLGHSLRSEDVLGRWGGEEFLVLLADVDAIQMGDLAERCRSLVAQSIIAAGQSRIQVTVSIGGALLDNFTSADAAISGVDELMYQSKNNGRNCTTLG